MINIFLGITILLYISIITFLIFATLKVIQTLLINKRRYMTNKAIDKMLMELLSTPKKQTQTTKKECNDCDECKYKSICKLKERGMI